MKFTRLPHRLTSNQVAFILAILTVLLTALWISPRTANALPEYATRTGEPCAACHVSAGGGGPRTIRGLLWAARGKPDAVPSLPGLLIAPGVEDGAELYQVACAGCHGIKGEGLSAIRLARMGIRLNSVLFFVQRGIPTLGMPSFEGQFTEAQLTTLVDYVAALSSGEILPQPDEYPLPPALFNCPPDPQEAVCHRNPVQPGGN